MPHKELLDPQGKTVAKNMKHVDIAGIEDVRIGKHIEMLLEATDVKDANEKTEKACKKILSNQIMEVYTFSVEEVV